MLLGILVVARPPLLTLVCFPRLRPLVHAQGEGLGRDKGGKQLKHTEQQMKAWGETKRESISSNQEQEMKTRGRTTGEGIP